MIDKVNICGVPYKVMYCDDNFDMDTHFGQISYSECVIKINKNMPKEMIEESLTHEIVHGILLHTGNSDYKNDERLVQSLANAIYQTFAIRQ